MSSDTEGAFRMTKALLGVRKVFAEASTTFRCWKVLSVVEKKFLLAEST
jgi:hypothetical protein